ncbi:hypothetical protein QW180_19905 [Vibrio sinaloensis]|nr:hypothetical protein [Vibrio sinaloensis]
MLKKDIEQHQTSVSHELSAQDMVHSVLSSFGLPVKDFESIFGVKRAAIYNWKKGTFDPSEAQFEILKKAYTIFQKNIADWWHQIGSSGKKTHLYKKMSHLLADYKQTTFKYQMLLNIMSCFLLR